MDHTASADIQLEQARTQFPGWDIQRVFGGYEAVPAGTKIIRATYLDTIIEKLKAEIADTGK